MNGIILFHQGIWVLKYIGSSAVFIPTDFHDTGFAFQFTLFWLSFIEFDVIA